MIPLAVKEFIFTVKIKPWGLICYVSVRVKEVIYIYIYILTLNELEKRMSIKGYFSSPKKEKKRKRRKEKERDLGNVFILWTCGRR